jgi:hypothetical protein
VQTYIVHTHTYTLEEEASSKKKPEAEEARRSQKKKPEDEEEEYRRIQHGQVSHVHTRRRTTARKS